LEQVNRLCNCAILLEKGKLIAKGKVKDVSAIYEAKINDAENN
jgi:ABC-2 type transport system ATP-binding protein